MGDFPKLWPKKQSGCFFGTRVYIVPTLLFGLSKDMSWIAVILTDNIDVLTCFVALGSTLCGIRVDRRLPCRTTGQWHGSAAVRQRECHKTDLDAEVRRRTVAHQRRAADQLYVDYSPAPAVASCACWNRHRGSEWQRLRYWVLLSWT